MTAKHREPWLLVAAITAASCIGVMPVFLVGANGGLMGNDMVIDNSRLGTIVGLGFASAAICSVFGGLLAERRGARPALFLALAMGAAALFAIAVGARSWWHVAICVVIGGAGNGVVLPAGNLALASRIQSRQGLAFGVKQGGPPMASLLAGAAVPLIGLSFGWRWSFAAAGVLALGLMAVLPSEAIPTRVVRRRNRGKPDLSAKQLAALALAAGIGVAVATATAGFLVENAVAAGLTTASAGWLLVASSIVSVIVRVIVGWIADRRTGGHLQFVAGMLATGSAGLLLVAVGGTAATVVGSLLAFGGAWGWTGLLMLTIVQSNPSAPATASGIVQIGASAGGAIGPVVFGISLTYLSYASGWVVVALFGLMASVLIAVSGRSIGPYDLRGTPGWTTGDNID